MKLQAKWDNKFSEESLEQLAIAIMQLKTKDGLLINVHYEDILQPWVASQFPVTKWTFCGTARQ